MNKKHSEMYSLVFDSLGNEIDSISLSESLKTITDATVEINSKLGTGNRMVIKVRTFKSGSFEVPFDVIEYAAAGLLAGQTPSHIQAVFNVLKEFIDIKVRLKGMPAKAVKNDNEKMSIVTESGEVYNIGPVAGDLIFNNPTINNSFNRSMGVLDDDSEISGIKINDASGNNLISVDRGEYEYFRRRELGPQDEERIEEIEANIYIHKIVFDRKSHWGFIYAGNHISAKICDSEYYDQVESTERFGNGDVLKVILAIHQVYDKSSGVYIHKGYKILKVLEHTPRPKQGDIFED